MRKLFSKVIKDFIYMVFLISIFSSLNATASELDNDELEAIASHFGVSVSDVIPTENDGCNLTNILEQYACYAAANYVYEEFDVTLSMDDDALALDYHLPNQKLDSETRFVDGRLKLRITGGKIVTLPSHPEFSNVNYPYIGKLPVRMEASGDGTIRHETINILGIKIKTDTDVDVSGSAKIDAIMGFTLDPKVVYIEGKPKIMLSPILRLFPDEDTYEDDIAVDVDSSFINLIADFFLGVPDGFIDTFTSDDGSEVFGNWLSTIGYIIADIAILYDDMTGDSLFKKVNSALADEDLDDETERFFYDIEKDLNEQISDALGADSEGHIYLDYPESIGIGTAQLVAINSILL